MKTLLIYILCFSISITASAENLCYSFFGKNAEAFQKIERLDQDAQILQNGLGNLVELLQTGTPKQQKAIRAGLERISYDSVSTENQIYNAVVTLYRIANTPKWNFLKSFTEKISVLEEREIQKKIETEILEENIITALKNLNLIEKQTQIGKIKRILTRSENTREFVSTAVINSFTYYWMNIFGAIPAVKLLEFQRATPEIKETVRKFGFKSSYPLFMKIFKNKARVDTVFKAIARTYVLYMIMLIPNMVYENFGFIKFGIGMATITTESLAKHERETFDPAKVRIELFNSWKGGYEAFNGKLDPFNPEHVHLMNQKKAELDARTDAELMVFN